MRPPAPTLFSIDGGRAGVFLELLHDQPGEQIVAAAGRKANDEMDRAARKVGLGSRRCRGKNGERRRQRADDRFMSSCHCIPRFAHRPPRPRLRKAYTGRGHTKTLLSDVLLFAHRQFPPGMI